MWPFFLFWKKNQRLFRWWTNSNVTGKWNAVQYSREGTGCLLAVREVSSHYSPLPPPPPPPPGSSEIPSLFVHCDRYTETESGMPSARARHIDCPRQGKRRNKSQKTQRQKKKTNSYLHLFIYKRAGAVQILISIHPIRKKKLISSWEFLRRIFEDFWWFLMDFLKDSDGFLPIFEDFEDF